MFLGRTTTASTYAKSSANKATTIGSTAETTATSTFKPAATDEKSAYGTAIYQAAAENNQQEPAEAEQ